MKGLPYKNTFAAKGSQLHTALEEGREADAKRIYAETTARQHALLNGLAVPVAKQEINKEGKQTGKFTLESIDAVYDNNGKLLKIKEKI